MSHDELPDNLRLDDAQVREIVERALREPAASSAITMAQLREIATELDIDQDALAAAAREVLSAEKQSPAQAVVSDAGTGIGRFALMGVLATAIGVFTTYVEAGGLDSVLGRTTMPGSGSFVDVPVGLFLIAVTALNAVSRFRAGRRTLFMLESVATWLGFMAGWSMGHGSITGDLLTFVGSVLAGASALAFLRFLRRRDRGDNATAIADVSAQPSNASSASDDQMNRGRVEALVAAYQSLVAPPLGGSAA